MFASHLRTMRARIALLSIVVLAACTAQADKQLEAVKSARSVLSEWALIETQADNGHAQATYTDQMRQASRDELKKAAEGLSQRPDAARLIERIRSGSPDAAALRNASSALEPLEKSLEAA